MKKVLLIVVDALASRVLLPAMDRGKLPNLLALTQTGSLDPQCVPVFPSITPGATASIVTGCYPRDHGILGAYWYDLENEELVYYSDDYWIIFNQGIDKFIEEFLIKLNHRRLQAETLYQRVERANLQAACLNYIIFHGDVSHTAQIPLLLSMLPGIPDSAEIYGPSILYLGDLVKTEFEATKERYTGQGGPMNRFGLTDEHTANILIHMAQNQLLPDFTLAYFPDNDFRSHEVGPEAAITTLEYLDKKLGELFAVYGEMETMLKEFCIIITGDHSQDDIHPDGAVAGIRLNELLTDLALVQPGEPWDQPDHLMVCPDMRIVQIYMRHPSLEKIEPIAARLLTDRRVDQVIWCECEQDQSKEPAAYYVATADRGRLRFWPGEAGPNTARDQYGHSWSWQGDLGPVSGHLSAANILTFREYPNAFERIAQGVSCRNSGHIWATARPGYEFQLPYTSIHAGGGSHGSLHVGDSTVPLLLAGAPAGIELPAPSRTVDVKPLCLSILGLDSRYSFSDNVFDS